MPENENIQVIGRGVNVEFTIDDTVPFEIAAEDLRQYLAKCHGLYAKGSISVNVGRRILVADELSGIKGILDRESGLTVSRYWCAPEVLERALAKEETPVPFANTQGLDRANGLDDFTPEAATASASANPELAFAPWSVVVQESVEPVNPEEGTTPGPSPTSSFSEDNLWRSRRGNEALVIKTTCRSGEVIHYPGDVVVLADVNPGAEIIAWGDIVVLGTLRGMAHAGAGGDLSATIIALNLESHRLGIGESFGEAPASVRQSKSAQAAGPKIAYLRRRSIYVAPFVRRGSEYQGGIAYEG